MADNKFDDLATRLGDGPLPIWLDNEDGPRFGCVLSLPTNDTPLDAVLSGEGRYQGVHVRITVDPALFGPAPWWTILIACKRAAAAWAHSSTTADRKRRGLSKRSYREEAHLLGYTREGLWKWRRTVLCDPVDLYGANPGRRPNGGAKS